MPFDNFEFLHLKKLNQQLQQALVAPKSQIRFNSQTSNLTSIIHDLSRSGAPRDSNQSTEQVSECDTATNSIRSAARRKEEHENNKLKEKITIVL